jgi:Fic family protein
MDAAKELKRVQAPVRALQGAQQHQRHTSSLHDKAVASQKAYNARELERLQQRLAKHRKFMNTPQSSPMLEDSKQNLGRLGLKQLEWAIDDIQRAPLSPRTQKPLTEANEALAKAKANAMQNYNVGRAAKLSKTDADTMGEVNDLFRKKDIHQNVSKGLGGTAAAGAGAAGVKKYKEQQTAPPATAAPPKLSDHIRRTLSNVR